MKNSISRSFIEVFEPAMKSKGFIRKGKVFHRIVNNKIVQCLGYYSYFMSRTFTITFTIRPLCFGREFGENMCDKRLCEVYAGIINPWYYEGAEGYTEYMPIALKATEEMLFPRFDTEIDYKSYDESYRKSKAFTKGWGIIPFDIFILALISEDYKEAQKIGDTQHEDWIKANMQQFGTEYHKVSERQEMFERRWKGYDRLKEAMNNGDRKTIDEYIASLEQKSLESYIKAYCTPKKYEKYLETRILPFEIVKV